MSNFAEFWTQQMEDPQMRVLMEETNRLLGRSQDGSKRLSEMDLTPEEEKRIFRILNSPRYPAAENAILMKVLGKNRWIQQMGAYLVKKHTKEFHKLAKGE